MTLYTVIATYEQTGQRYAACVEADSPAYAELAAQHQCCVDNGWTTEAEVGHWPLEVAGVIEGHHEVVA